MNIIILIGFIIVASLLVSISLAACKVSSECEYASYLDYIKLLEKSGVPKDKLPSYNDFIMRDIVLKKK